MMNDKGIPFQIIDWKLIPKTEHKKIQPIIQEKEKNMKEEKEKVQQSLFDF